MTKIEQFEKLLCNFGTRTKRLKRLNYITEAYPSVGNYNSGPKYALAYSSNIFRYDFDEINLKLNNLSELIFGKSRINLSYGGFIPAIEKSTDDNKLLKIFSILLSDETNKYKNEFKVNKIYEVNLVQLLEPNYNLYECSKTEYSRLGIAIKFYKYLSNQGISLLGDGEQYLGARRLWSKLSKQLNYQVDIVNIKTKEILISDTEIYHGYTDEEFDKRVWSFDNEVIRDEVRILLRSKK